MENQIADNVKSKIIQGVLKKLIFSQLIAFKSEMKLCHDHEKYAELIDTTKYAGLAFHLFKVFIGIFKSDIRQQALDVWTDIVYFHFFFLFNCLHFYQFCEHS